MSRRRGPATHACPEHLGYATLCRQDIRPGDGLSCHAAAWTCRACLRMDRLLVRVEEAASQVGRWEDVRALLEAVVPGGRAIYMLSEDEARRCLVVLRAVLGGGA